MGIVEPLRSVLFNIVQADVANAAERKGDGPYDPYKKKIVHMACGPICLLLQFWIPPKCDEVGRQSPPENGKYLGRIDA